MRRKGENKKRKKRKRVRGAVPWTGTGRRLEGRKGTEGREGRSCWVSYNFLSCALNQEVARFWVLSYATGTSSFLLCFYLGPLGRKEGVLIYRRLSVDGWMGNNMMVMIVEAP